MSRLLEILGRAITIDTADLIWHWLATVKLYQPDPGANRIQQLNKIASLVSEKKTETAQQQLRLYLFENPSCIYGRMTAAAICLHINQLDSAIEELNSVYLSQPSNTMALYALGHCYERLGKESQAVEFYQDCLKFKNHLQLPRQRLAAIYLKNGQLEKSIEEYELLKTEYPDDIVTLIMLGYLYIAAERNTDAIEIFNTAILIHPDNFQDENDDVNELIANGRFQEALDQLASLLNNHDERPDLLTKRADVLAMLGDTTESISQYKQALRIRPHFLEATIKLGTQYLQLNQHRLAAQQFNKAMEINDQIVDAYIGLAAAQKLADNTSDALGTLSLATAIDSNSLLLFAETATLQFKAHLTATLPFLTDYDEPADPIINVIQAHRHQLSQQPQNPDFHYRLGVLMMCIGKIPDALEPFRSALEINPLHSRAMTKLVVSLFETGQKDAALRQLTPATSLDKNTLQLHYKTALLYCDRIKFASSLMNLEEYMQNNFTAADATVNISIVLQNLGLLDRAAIMWDNLSDTTSQAINNSN